jgi:putative transposase
MAKRKTQFVPGEFYHIYNRGNARQNIFYNDKDKYRFLQAIYLSNNINNFIRIAELEIKKSGFSLAEIEEILKNNKISYDPLVKIFADCLMSNHYHLLVQETKEGGITNFMQKIGTSYAKYFTIKYNRPGSLFQGRFKAVHIKSDSQLKYLIAYINVINPAQIVEPNLKEEGIKNFEETWDVVKNYKWSTHFDFLEKRKSILIDKNLIKEFYPKTQDYINFVKNILQEKDRKLWASIEGSTID